MNAVRVLNDSRCPWQTYDIGEMPVAEYLEYTLAEAVPEGACLLISLAMPALTSETLRKATPPCRLGEGAWLLKVEDVPAEAEDAALLKVEGCAEISLDEEEGRLCTDAYAHMRLNRWINGRRIEALLRSGVLIPDPSGITVSADSTVEAGTLLRTGTVLRRGTRIGAGCDIGPYTVLEHCTVGESTLIKASVGTDAQVGNYVKVGPYCHLRPNTCLKDRVKLGDFVEVKNSTMGERSQASHLTYIGDSDVGSGVNFGCGTVTVNYDGFGKARCRVGDGVFIGCNTNLIAPVEVQEGAYIAAGSTITQDVPADSLAIARCRQTNKEGWAAQNREKKKK